MVCGREKDGYTTLGNQGIFALMRALLSYWWVILSRAWRESWMTVIKHSVRDIIRDLCVLALTFGLAFWLNSTLVRDQLMSNDNTKDTLIWALIALLALIGAFAGVFVFHALLLTPYRVWREAHALATNLQKSPEITAKALERQAAIYEEKIQQIDQQRQNAESLFRLSQALEDMEREHSDFTRQSEYLQNRTNWTPPDINMRPDTLASYIAIVQREKMEAYAKKIQEFLPDANINIFDDSDMPEQIKNRISHEELRGFQSRVDLATYYKFQHGRQKFDKLIRDAQNRITSTLNHVRNTIPVSTAIKRLES